MKFRYHYYVKFISRHSSEAYSNHTTKMFDFPHAHVKAGQGNVGKY